VTSKYQVEEDRAICRKHLVAPTLSGGKGPKINGLSDGRPMKEWSMQAPQDFQYEKLLVEFTLPKSKNLSIVNLPLCHLKFMLQSRIKAPLPLLSSWLPSSTDNKCIALPHLSMVLLVAQAALKEELQQVWPGTGWHCVLGNDADNISACSAN
jgi:hypothetical protein